MALAPLAHMLFTKVMQHDPSEPHWPDRDRFVLSVGHASILIYSMLYLTGYGLELDDIKQFRQWGSLTPGHPEVHHTRGIEVTTGPLGQGVANGVGMGIAERYLRSRFGPELCNHHTFVICGDGDLMEGISHEACSLAGHLGLGRLIYVYDDNHITIDGPTELALSDDAGQRFASYGWDVHEVGEIANDTVALEAAIRAAMAVEDKPSFIRLRSHIGWPSSKADTSSAHGEPLGDDVVRATKELLNLDPDEAFWVPEEVLAMYRECIPRGQAKRKVWEERFESWSGDKASWEAAMDGSGLDGWADALPTFAPGESIATRAASGKVLNALAPVVPGIMAGGADLTGNTGTKLNDAERQSVEHPGGRYIAFGVREHGMAGVMNGMAHHGGTLPVGGTFFCFADYMRGSVRLSALSEAKVVYSFTHDSVGLGPDGPTHQPIEHLASLRAMPGLRVIRPADANETSHAWRVAIGADGPTALVLTRQNLPVLEGTAEAADGVARGGYVLRDAANDSGEPDLVLIGTGSEVQLCVAAADLLQAEGIAARVVSLPSWDLFEAQSDEYQSEVLPEYLPALAVEAAASFGWGRFADETVSIDRFGASAPGDVVMKELGFTPEHVAERAKELLTAYLDIDQED